MDSQCLLDQFEPTLLTAPACMTPKNKYVPVKRHLFSLSIETTKSPKKNNIFRMINLWNPFRNVRKIVDRRSLWYRSIFSWSDCLFCSIIINLISNCSFIHGNSIKWPYTQSFTPKFTRIVWFRSNLFVFWVLFKHNQRSNR